ncbi:MAG: hypothetical protein HQL73_10925, partial [Magnetococcales bacterium]|nr:hypothetical protein [Magnetococcales bacterium]
MNAVPEKKTAALIAITARGVTAAVRIRDQYWREAHVFALAARSGECG